jgi:hypothetical protein
MQGRKFRLLGCGLVVLAACAASQSFDTAHVNDVAKGVQDKEQIRGWFGEPHQVQSPIPNHPAGCVERWTYAQKAADGAGESLVVDFDAAGKVCDNAYVKQPN